jgi:WD40 repeat protein
MEVCRAVRIFLSYGHDVYGSLAEQIKKDLEADHEVWFDTARIRPGADWEQYVQDGLDFASAVPDAGRFLLLMTPHSVRRPDGYCLNELARALSRNLPVIPVMVSDVEPPLSICRLQWLDMRDCLPVDQNEERYRARLRKLVKALEEKQAPFEGAQQRLLSYLRPLTYADDLRRHLLRFTGRTWLAPVVDRWLASTRQILWITGEAGVGKSAVSAWLCRQRSEIAAYHFFHFGNSDRTDASRALFSLAYQLATQLPDYWDRLNASSLDKIAAETNLAAIFDQLFVNLLSDGAPLSGRPKVLLIDALDEAASVGKNGLASLIGREFKRLPSWLRTIVTSRPHEREINYALQALDPWKLDGRREENVRDIRAYLERELRPFEAEGVSLESAARQIVNKSEYLFLYVSWVRQELEDGRLSLKDVDRFPPGLGGIFAGFFQRYFPDLAEYETLCRPALETICAVREPIALVILSSLLGRSEYEMRRLLARLGSLFPAVDGCIGPFHQSLLDWLVDPSRSGDYWIDIRAEEQRLAELAWHEYTEGITTMGQYCIKHAVSHLAACRRNDALKRLLLDPEWIQAKLRVSGVVPLIADYDLGLEVLPPKSKPEGNGEDGCSVRAIELVRGAIRLSFHVIEDDPIQCPSQMTGRLLPFYDLAPIREFVERTALCASKPWLRPLRPALHPPGSSLLRTLVGHTSSVYAIVVAADGKRAISGSHDGTSKEWDLESGVALRTFDGDSGPVYGVALTRSGKHAISAFYDGTLGVWDIGTGSPLRTLKGHAGEVFSVAIVPDKEWAISGSRDKTLKLWNLETGCLLRTFEGHSHLVRTIAVTPDGTNVLSGSWDKTLKLWDLETGCLLRTLEGHVGAVEGLTITPAGDRAISASGDGILKIWRLADGVPLQTIDGQSGSNGLAVTPDGKQFISASRDSLLRLWDLQTGSLLHVFDGHVHFVAGVAVTPDGKRAISTSGDNTVKVWSLEAGAIPTATVRHHTGPVSAVAPLPDGRVISASYDRTLKFWDPKTGNVLSTLAGHRGWIFAVATDGRRAVSAGADGTLMVWDVQTCLCVGSMQYGCAYVNCVALSPDGLWAAFGAHDNSVCLWDLRSRYPFAIFTGHSGPVSGVAVAMGGRCLISASQDGTLKMWDTRTGGQLATFVGHSAPVRRVAVTADGSRALSACRDKTVKVWDCRTAALLMTLEGHSDFVNDVAVRHDGRYAVSASSDSALKVWDLSSGRCLATFRCDGQAETCSFVADDVIVAGDQGGRLHFLEFRI